MICTSVAVRSPKRFRRLRPSESEGRASMSSKHTPTSSSSSQFSPTWKSGVRSKSLEESSKLRVAGKIVQDFDAGGNSAPSAHSGIPARYVYNRANHSSDDVFCAPCDTFDERQAEISSNVKSFAPTPSPPPPSTPTRRQQIPIDYLATLSSFHEDTPHSEARANSVVRAKRKGDGREADSEQHLGDLYAESGQT